MNAMVLAAGLGTRMRPITDTIPKPLVEVAGKPLIDYALDALAAVGAGRVVVNVHYLPQQIRSHLETISGFETLVSDETDRLLDSGGGVAKAMPLLGEAPFYVLNADTFWIEDPSVPQTNLQALADAFDPDRMDMLLMLAGLSQATGDGGRGDFVRDAEGRLARFDGGNGEPLIYAGAMVCHPRALAAAPEGPFSLNRCFDAAMAEGRLHGWPMRGHWLTVGTPAAIAEAEAVIAELARPRNAG